MKINGHAPDIHTFIRNEHNEDNDHVLRHDMPKIHNKYMTSEHTI